MKHLPKDVVEAGERIASDLLDVAIAKSMNGLGGCQSKDTQDYQDSDLIQAYLDECQSKDIQDYEDSDLIQAYLDEEISSVEAIYVAMRRVAEKE